MNDAARGALPAAASTVSRFGAHHWGAAPYPMPTTGWLALRSANAVLVVLTAGLVSVLCIDEVVVIPAVVFVLAGTAGYRLAGLSGASGRRVFAASYLGACAVTVVLYWLYLARFGAPYYGGGSDDLMYESLAREVTLLLPPFDYVGIGERVAGADHHNSLGYVYLVSLMIRAASWLGGFHTTVPRFVNCLALGWVAVLTCTIARRLGVPPGIAERAGVLCGCLPTMAFHAAHTFREAVVALLCVGLVAALTPGRHTGSAQRAAWELPAVLLGWVLTGLVLTQFRALQVVVVVCAGGLGAAAGAVRRAGPGAARALVGLLSTAVLALVALALVAQLSERVQAESDFYVSYRQDLGSGFSRYVFGATPPLGYFLRVAYSVIAPFPVFNGLPEAAYLGIGTIVASFYTPCLVVGLCLAARQPRAWPLAGAFVLTYSGVTFGTFSGRQAVQYLPFAAALAALGYGRMRPWRRLAAIAAACSWCVVFGAYALI